MTPSPSPATAADALSTGLVDAAGFVGGALAGWQLGRWLGFDLLAGGSGIDSGSLSRDNLIGWAFLLGGLALGKWAAMRWHRQRQSRRADTKPRT